MTLQGEMIWLLESLRALQWSQMRTKTGKLYRTLDQLRVSCNGGVRIGNRANSTSTSAVLLGLEETVAGGFDV